MFRGRLTDRGDPHQNPSPEHPTTMVRQLVWSQAYPAAGTVCLTARLTRVFGLL